MNESTPLEHLAQDAGGAASVAVTSAGTLLRQGRVAAGLHIAALAVSLKVPVRRLEALESDRFDLLPDAVFVRALASSVCRALKMDVAPVLALLPASMPPRLKDYSTRTHDAYTSGASARGLPVWRSLPRPVVVSAAVLLLATLGLVAWPLVQDSWGNPEASPAASGALVPTEVLQPVSDIVVSPVVPVFPSQTVGTMAIAASPLASLPAPAAIAAAAAASASAPLPAAASSTSRPVAAQPSVTVPTVSGVVIFSTSAASWVEVTDANGTVVLRRMLGAGEVAGASGTLPLSAVVGRADVTKVQVRGQAFDLSSIARENVARFEVK